MSEQKQKGPALDQAQALAANIPGAIPRPAMVSDPEPVTVEPVEPVKPDADDFYAQPRRSPMVVDLDVPGEAPKRAPRRKSSTAKRKPTSD